jgi:predicted nucleotidyltransferase
VSEDAYRAAIDRFRAAAAADPLVLAAFLGGSYAAGRATETSDVDVYVVTKRDDYEAFWARRRKFIAAWGDPVALEDVVDFEGLGFDMVRFRFRDGVHGELAFGHSDNFRVIHGGPYEVHVDPRAPARRRRVPAALGTVAKTRITRSRICRAPPARPAGAASPAQAARSFSRQSGSRSRSRRTRSPTVGCVTKSAARPSSANGLVV